MKKYDFQYLYHFYFLREIFLIIIVKIEEIWMRKMKEIKMKLEQL